MTRTSASNSPARKFIRRIPGFALILAGLWFFVFGNIWAPLALELLPDSEIGLWVELIVPFLPMLIIGIGTVLLSRITSV
jgi:hypothetical protein